VFWFFFIQSYSLVSQVWNAMIIIQVGTQAKVGGIKFLVVELNNWNCFIFQVSSLFSWKYVRVMSQSNLGFESHTDDNVIHKCVQHQVDPPWEGRESSSISFMGWCHSNSEFNIHIEPNKWPRHWAWWIGFVNLRSTCSSYFLKSWLAF
jgi:hypothetical protein